MRQRRGQGEFFFAVGFWVDRMLSGRLAVGSPGCRVAWLSGPGLSLALSRVFCCRVLGLSGHLLIGSQGCRVMGLSSIGPPSAPAGTLEVLGSLVVPCRVEILNF